MEEAIGRLDLGLFAPVVSQTSMLDRKALLAVQRAVRRHVGPYVYLEIGSHLGGSIQPHLRDPRCRRIYSIDKRPHAQPDDRWPGQPVEYLDNSSRRMLELLRPLAPGQIDKIVCIDKDVSEVSPDLIADAPDLCFIDGEHTYRAAVADFQFCLSVAKPDAVICFHDRTVIAKAIADITETLTRSRVSHRGIAVGDDVYVLALGGAWLFDDPDFRAATRREATHHGGAGLSRRFRSWYQRIAPGWVRRMVGSVAVTMRARR